MLCYSAAAALGEPENCFATCSICRHVCGFLHLQPAKEFSDRELMGLLPTCHFSLWKTRHANDSRDAACNWYQLV